jgi:metal-responsive CopG/Arc/MetJ family transcriptional regulator
MEVILPKSLVAQIISTAIKRPDLGYISLTEFIRDAIKNFIKQHSETNSE